MPPVVGSSPAAPGTRGAIGISPAAYPPAVPGTPRGPMPKGHVTTLWASLTMLPVVLLGFPLIAAFGLYHAARAWVASVYSHYVRPHFDRRDLSLPPHGSAQVYHHPALAEPAITIAAKLRSGQYSSVEVTSAFINQVQRVNASMNAVCDNRWEDALADARAADEMLREARAGERVWEDVPPFTGVPCTIKDCIAVKGLIQCSGVVARKSAAFRAPEDATVVARYRAAGFIISQNTNTSELCMWYSSANYAYGITRNAYDGARIVGGSSGGEAALISAAGAPCGIGSDIGGSIRMPAGFNGIFGHKATGGLVPGTGQYPFTPYPFLTTGPLCRYSDDLWPLLMTLAGPDGLDVSAVPTPLLEVDLPLPRAALRATMSPTFHATDNGTLGSPAALRLVDRVDRRAGAALLASPHATNDMGTGAGAGARRRSIASRSRSPTPTPRSAARRAASPSSALAAPQRGLGRGAPPAVTSWSQVTVVKMADFPATKPRFTTAVQPSILRAIDVAADTLISRFGCAGVQEFAMPELVDAFDLWAAVLNEAPGQPTFFELMTAAHGRPLNLGWETVKWALGASEATLPALVLAAIEKLPQYALPGVHAAALASAAALRTRIHDTLSACNGVLLFPVHPTTAPLHDVTLVRPFNCAYTQLFNVLEVPVTVVPMGLDRDGLPVAIQVVGARGADRLTIAVAQALEHSGVGGWVPPRLALAAGAPASS
jgi:Asp-tRNA(Asn)/Glu-tRNA(Gln) amidotransferase A subunit family amidase